mgnify:FL=1
MNETDLILPMFNMIGSLIKQLTGKTIVVCVRDKAGEIYHLTPNELEVTYIQAEVVNQRDEFGVPVALRCAFHDSLGPKMQEPRQSPERLYNAVFDSA